jgi:hypothetical protein
MKKKLMIVMLSMPVACASFGDREDRADRGPNAGPRYSKPIVVTRGPGGRVGFYPDLGLPHSSPANPAQALVAATESASATAPGESALRGSTPLSALPVNTPVMPREGSCAEFGNGSFTNKPPVGSNDFREKRLAGEDHTGLRRPASFEFPEQPQRPGRFPKSSSVTFGDEDHPTSSPNAQAPAGRRLSSSRLCTGSPRTPTRTP